MDIVDSIEEFVRRHTEMGSPKITGRRIFRPHAVNARVKSRFYTLEITIGAVVYGIPGFESEHLAEEAFVTATK